MKSEQEKQPLPSTLYTEEYFLTACEGYDEFTTTEGEQLSRRLSAAFKLAEITPGMTILDVGCGRGEILRHCAKLGADSIGIDYAAVAVKMSQNVIQGVNDVEPGKMLSGIPAFDNREWLRSIAAFRRLGDMARLLRDLQNRAL